jgi:phosphoglycolate phosphatase
MNPLLVDRNLPLLTENRYREVFTFPVQDYYEQLGFNFLVEKFEIPAMQFIENYLKYLPNVGLFPEVEVVLNEFKKQGLHQYILSAMEQDSLAVSVKNLGIGNYFEEIVGIQDHFARSKIESGKQLVKLKNLDKSKTIMVGDTLHDLEVAEALEIECALVAQGHQAFKKLAVNGNKVVNSLFDLGTLFSS